MPTAVSAPSSNPRKPIERSASNPIPRKRRPVKRRGRARDEFESDDEFEREVRTDSETDDDHSSIDSESDSESSSDDIHADAHSEVVTPSTTQSPPPVELAGLPNGSSKDGADGQAAMFSDTTNWAEMVADEAANGASSLPVIDFADMDGARLERHASPAPRARKAGKANKKRAAKRASSAPPPPGTPKPAEEAPPTADATASTSHERDVPDSPQAHHSRALSARQAYQQRLESDPSFVPKVGEFWGHDDRLLDKEFRSLSGWWRGRWQSRGRGRGGPAFRGRGRGFYGHSSGYGHEDGPRSDDAPNQQEEVPPVERQWTHDGFEEMKRRDEQRRTQQERQHQSQNGPVRGFGFRGRGFVPARGRGGFGRGGASSPATSRHSLSNIAMGDRVWYAQKPEKMWTRKPDPTLYSEVPPKSRPDAGPPIRVKLPGAKRSSIVKLPSQANPAPSDKTDSAPSAQNEVDKAFVVRLPPRPGKEKAIEEPPAAPSTTELLATTGEELTIEEIFTVRPHVVPNRRVDLSLPQVAAAEKPQRSTASERPSSPIQTASSSSRQAAEEVRNPLEQIIVPTAPIADGRTSPSPIIQETILRNPPASEGSTSGTTSAPVEEPRPQRPAPPVLHPLQTSFTPMPPPTSPPYGSPYAFAPALPPGVAVNHQGMAYEYATGRPVYIQPTPPPMFTPRPMMHTHHPSLSMPFVPSHLRHHSAASPDFLAHPHTPPVASYVDPITGVPIFAPARQSSRIEIRAPSDATDGKKSSKPSHQRSGLSTSSITANNAEETQQPSYFPPQDVSVSGETSAEQQQQQPMDHSHAPPMDPAVAYAPYPPAYYYPEQYGYAPYVDMSQQAMHYEMYPPEQLTHHHHHSHSQPVVYY
ncbi:hypothetical protein C8Q73DRAFT_680482 [Cubamyces lactineus]|nr:hypothetical protein C8Q73DRAFT_680482 [Cubamyces lactineus]